MALAKKCDRCGKLYEIKRISKASNRATCSEDHSLDLCPECMSEFNKFIVGGKFDAT